MPASIAETKLLECLKKVGRGLIASGTSVGVVENTLTEIAQAHGAKSEIVALPNIIMIKLGQTTAGQFDFTVQRLTSLPLDQISELVELIDQLKQGRVLPSEASTRIDRILARPPRFGTPLVLLGFVLSSVGLTLLFRLDPLALAVTALMGLIVGLIVLWFQTWPRFSLLLPIIAAVIVSTLVFSLTKFGVIYGPTNLIIPPLVTFLPGAALTTGMIELASMQVISGSSRLIYGVTSLLLLFAGVAAGLYLSGLQQSLVYGYTWSGSWWWAPVLGTLLFGLGTFIRVSGANRDLLWILVVLYVAILGQTIGEALLSPYLGAFLGAALMALVSEFIARSPRRTPALVSQALAFWFLVPGARGLLSVASLLTQDLQGALIGLVQMVGLIIAIAVGVLLGTLLVSPNKFAPVTTSAGPRRRGQG
jgi:uncharacterized membrane protein YjjP (DUF1212 family)/uncharacterized membrane protein YjjB (DUF3815 family)